MPFQSHGQIELHFKFNICYTRTSLDYNINANFFFLRFFFGNIRWCSIYCVMFTFISPLPCNDKWCFELWKCKNFQIPMWKISVTHVVLQSCQIMFNNLMCSLCDLGKMLFVRWREKSFYTILRTWRVRLL